MNSQLTSRPKLLVVDDEPDNLDLLYRTFHRDYTVLRAENGPAALEILAQEGDVAVIISDQRMPLMRGVEFLALAATQYPDIIRIILTGYTDVEDLVEAINAGKVFKFVTKPWNAEELKVVVRQAMDTHNVLKVRTRELSRALRRESLLNTVINTIRNAQYGKSGGSPLQQILQRIVESVGHLLEVDICILRPFQEEESSYEWFVYQKKPRVWLAPEGPLRSGHAGVQNSVTRVDTNEPDDWRSLSDSRSSRYVSPTAGATVPYESQNSEAALSKLVREQGSEEEDVPSQSKPLQLGEPNLEVPRRGDSQMKGPDTENMSLLPNLSTEASPLEQTLWETRDVEVINDVTSHERFTGDSPEVRQRSLAYQQLDIRSTLVVPLISRQELVAVLALHRCGEPYVWQDDEIQLVVMVADQAALALSQARSYEQVQALAKQQALVNTITTAIRSTLDPQEIFTAITQKLGQALQVDGCTLSLWTEEDEFVQCVGLYDGKTSQVLGTQTEVAAPSWGDTNQPQKQNYQSTRAHPDTPTPPHPGTNSSHLPQSIVPISGNPVLQKLVNTQQPVVLDDLMLHPEMNGIDLPLRSPARALLVVPLLSDSASTRTATRGTTSSAVQGKTGKIIGSITLRQTHKPRHWLSSEIELAQAVASQAAIAVQQSQLYQKTRLQAERLLELDRQKTEFFQNVSHEFRTPLTLMIGPLESAVEQHYDLPYPECEIALRNSRRLLRLVNQLLDIQRLDAGRMQAKFRPCDLVEFVSQIVEAFRPYCQRKNISIHTQLTGKALVYLDLEKFDKILYNLLSNAMKFTNPGGKITIKIEPAGDHIRMQITDTGIGIRTEQIPHLFERFRQAEGSVNRSYEGSGLGLALVKELVELHRGQISVQSVYSQGTTFDLWLQTGTNHLPTNQILEIPTEKLFSRAPVELADLDIEIPKSEQETQTLTTSEDQRNLEDTNTHPNTHPQPLLPKTQNRILVVEDNLDVQTYISRILRQEKYQIFTARDGEEGFRIAQEHHPHLIVTDLMMPVVSGHHLIHLIRSTEKLKGTPIILLTAKADEATRIESTQQGADAYLSKPFNHRELLAEVRNLLALKANEQRVIELNTYLTESVLKRFLPPMMVQKAAKGELLLDLNPEPRLITTLFSDIVGFTQMSNTLRARRVAELLNEYLEAMTAAVFDNGGTIDKFMGDGILAIFGAPEELTANEQVRRAAAAARAMLRSLNQLNQHWTEQRILGDNGLPLVQFRCGIHQGTAMVGMFGGKQRSDYTAIGPSVNIAARLQQAAQPNSVLVSAAVADYMEDDAITKFSPLQLKGIDETVLAFAIKQEWLDQ
jgi:signal transduction histidine kinase/class 3 adenylate cyclase/ActR/RegA family two-component response regulator